MPLPRAPPGNPPESTQNPQGQSLANEGEAAPWTSTPARHSRTPRTSPSASASAFQQGQVRRREVQKKVTEHAKETSTFIATRAQDGRVKIETLANDVRAKASAARDDVSGRVEPLVGDLGQRVQPIVEQLQTVPAQVKQAAEAGVSRAKELVNRAA